VRDDGKALVTHAVLFPAENVIKVVAAVGAAGIVAAKATPHVKNRFNDLKSKPEPQVGGHRRGHRTISQQDR
jgi:hypothetical protein